METSVIKDEAGGRNRVSLVFCSLIMSIIFKLCIMLILKIIYP